MHFRTSLISSAFILALTATAAIATPVQLTAPSGTTVDAPGESAGNKAGFVLGWTRTTLSSPVTVDFRARQFSPAGKAVGKELIFDSKPQGLYDPTVVPGSGSTVAGFWLRPAEGMVARLGNSKTGAMGAEKIFFTASADRLAEANFDVVGLKDGKFLVVTYRYETSPTIAKQVSYTLLSPTLSVLKGPTFLSGPRASYVATAASDFTAVPLKNGSGLVVYRNRNDGNIYAGPIASGPFGVAPVKVNQQSMPLGSGGQQTTFEVEAAQLKNGTIVVAWTRIGSSNADDAFDIQYRLLSASGKPIGSERTAHASLAEEQVAPEIVPLSNGGFELSWTNNGGPVEGHPVSYMVRRFSAAGLPQAAEVEVFSGERGFNSQNHELVGAGAGLMVIHGTGTNPTAIEGLPVTP